MGCFGFLKAMMFAFNGIIFLVGVVILSAGIWVKVDSGSILSLVEKIEDAPAGLSEVLKVDVLLITVGALMLIIGFLGCCGAAKESKLMLLVFFVIVTLVVLVEVAAGLMLLVKPLAEEWIDNLGAKAVQSIKKDFGDNHDITGLWNITMFALGCCGFYNYTDFTNSPYYNTYANTYPLQCCSNTVYPCTSAVASSMTVIGCFSKLYKLIDDNIVITVAVVMTLMAVEICALAVSMILYCQIKLKSMKRR
ncbi:tetraspanin-1-like isoform X2 [Thalassophryne amazonica]|nr:tetraspanin-1-like isoform X2 [Thalassophryne amazonica]